MATTIDELVVTLGLDPSNFTKGQKEALDDFKKTQDAAKKMAGQMEQDGKQAARFYSNIKSEALSLIAVLVGAHDIQKFVGDAVSNLSAAGRIATVMGQATPDVLAVSMAVQRMNGNAQEAQQSMLGLSQALERYSRFGEGSLEFKRGLGMIGAGPSDTPLQVLQKFATWAQGKRPQDVELIGQQVGLNQDLINLTIGGRGKFDAAIRQSYANGIPTDADIKKVQDLQAAFFNLAQSLKYAGTELVVDVADPLTHLMNQITTLIHDFPTATKITLALVSALIALKGLGLTIAAARALAGLGGGAAAGGAGAAAAGGAEVAGGGIGAVAGGLAIGGAIGAGAAALFWPSNLGTDIDVWRPVIENMGQQPDARLRAAIKFFEGRLSSNVQGPNARFYIGVLNALAGELNRRHGGAAGGGVIPEHVAGRAAAASGILQGAGLGLSGAQVQGIVAGLYAETAGTLSPDIKNPHSTARGLAQWTRSSGRQGMFEQVMGKPLAGSSFREQMQFILWEFANTSMGRQALADIMRQGTAGGAARAFLTDFEAPGAGGLALDLPMANRFLAGGGGTSVQIDAINIYPKGGDAREIAREIKRELAHQVATNANGAMN